MEALAFKSDVTISAAERYVLGRENNHALG
jgi:hypothetical protein